ncbi:MAG TPA: Ldh family oxidoreductase [Gaiellaceae bacterium]|jgi:LDH2 family malate/lactate/ureidoglycolate dehydrogenase
MRPEEAKPRLAALGFSPAQVDVLGDHFLDAERRGQLGHGLSRIEWLETWDEIDTSSVPQCVVDEPGYQRWDGNGALGYIALHAAVQAQIASPPEHARVVVCVRTFPTGSLGYWVRMLADAGLVGLLTATSPRRLASPDGGPQLAGTNPIAIAIPSSDGAPLVSDVSMGAITHGEVLAGRARAEDLVPFGGPLAHKSFALAVGLHTLVDALLPAEGFGAFLVVARPESDPVPALVALADGVRLPGSPGRR